MKDTKFPEQKSTESKLKERLHERAPALARNVFRLGLALSHRNPDEAIKGVVGLGMKMAGANAAETYRDSVFRESPFYNRETPVLRLAHALLSLGPTILTQKPEVTMATIDRHAGLISEAEMREHIIAYHETGILQTHVPAVIRNRIYALRLAYTSDAPHTDWSIFEKVGGAFAGRVANFSAVEPLSAQECANTVAILENLRPDSFSEEIKIYVAGCCLEAGLYTVEPVPYLAFADPHLSSMIYNESGARRDDAKAAAIVARFAALRSAPGTLHEVSEDPVEVQACRLLGIEILAEKACED